MAHRVCPWWKGYLLLSPLRRLRESPSKMLRPWVREGMTVLEPGPGMGFFTLDLARLVGPSGRVVAVDLQERMLTRLRRRARRRGLADRIELRLGHGESLGIDDLLGRVDLCVAIHVTHEMPDAGLFFREVGGALTGGGEVLLVEPPDHVSETELDEMLVAAEEGGLEVVRRPVEGNPRSALLRRR